MPSPRAVVKGLVAVVLTGEAWMHAGASLYRIAIGFGSALVVAVLMGLASFLWRSARIAVADVVTVLNSTSVFVWIVVSLIWFGLTNMAPIFTTFMITLPVVAANVVEGVASVDRRLLEMGQVYRLSGWEKFRSIVIPSTVPRAEGVRRRRDLRGDERDRLHHELQPRDPGDPDGVRLGAGHDRHHARGRQARVRVADAPSRALALTPPGPVPSALQGLAGTVR
jgi:hypothetical protein